MKSEKVQGRVIVGRDASDQILEALVGEINAHPLIVPDALVIQAINPQGKGQDDDRDYGYLAQVKAQQTRFQMLAHLHVG